MGEIKSYISDFKEYLSNKKTYSYGYKGSESYSSYQSSYYTLYFYEMSSMNRGYTCYKSYDEFKAKMDEYKVTIPENLVGELKKNGLHYAVCKPHKAEVICCDSYFGIQSKLNNEWNAYIMEHKALGEYDHISKYIKNCKENLYITSSYNPFLENYKIKYYIDSCKNRDEYVGFNSVDDLYDFLTINKLDIGTSHSKLITDNFNDVECFHCAKGSSPSSKMVSVSKFSFESVENLVNYSYSTSYKSTGYMGSAYYSDYDSYDD